MLILQLVLNFAFYFRFSPLKHRWDQLPDVKSPIQGIGELHRFLPTDENTISCELFSSATYSQEFKMIDTGKTVRTNPTVQTSEIFLVIFDFVFSRSTFVIQYLSGF